MSISSKNNSPRTLKKYKEKSLYHYSSDLVRSRETPAGKRDSRDPARERSEEAAWRSPAGKRTTEH